MDVALAGLKHRKLSALGSVLFDHLHYLLIWVPGLALGDWMVSGYRRYNLVLPTA